LPLPRVGRACLQLRLKTGTFAERGRKERSRIYDVLQSQRRRASIHPIAVDRASEFTTALRKTMKRRDARHIVAVSVRMARV